jgi:hypothetical protein
MKIFLLFLLACFTGDLASAQVYDLNLYEYHVMRDQTLSAIADNFGIFPEDIYEYNELEDHDIDDPLWGEDIDLEDEIKIIYVPLKNLYNQFPELIIGTRSVVGKNDFTHNSPYAKLKAPMPFVFKYHLNDNMQLWPLITAQANFDEKSEHKNGLFTESGSSWSIGLGTRLQSVNAYLTLCMNYRQVDVNQSLANGFTENFFMRSIGGILEGKVYAKRNRRGVFASQAGFSLEYLTMLQQNGNVSNWRYEPISHALLTNYFKINGNFSLFDIYFGDWLIGIEPQASYIGANFDGSNRLHQYYDIGCNLPLLINGLEIAKAYISYKINKMDNPQISGQISSCFVGVELNIISIGASAYDSVFK